MWDCYFQNVYSKFVWVCLFSFILNFKEDTKWPLLKRKCLEPCNQHCIWRNLSEFGLQTLCNTGFLFEDSFEFHQQGIFGARTTAFEIKQWIKETKIIFYLPNHQFTTICIISLCLKSYKLQIYVILVPNFYFWWRTIFCMCVYIVNQNPKQFRPNLVEFGKYISSY